MTTFSRRRLLALPAATLASFIPTTAQSSDRWPGESMEPEERVQFVYDITQLHTGRINDLKAEVDGLKELAIYALKLFGFSNPVKQNDGGDV